MLLNEILVVLMFLTFIGLLFTGFPIAFVLGGVAVLFTLVGVISDTFFHTSVGIDFGIIGMVADRCYKLMDNWVMVAVPMFIFMGHMLDNSGIAERMMKNMQNVFGKVHGGLALTVALIGIILAASTGIVGASVVLLGLMSLPVMLRQGYSKTLAVGTVAASGTLGILIPPSIMLVIMADQLGLAVGDLFMGAMIPGLLLGCFYLIYIIGYGLIRPKDAPLADDRKPINFKLIWDLLKTVLPPFALIIAVLGSIFAGIASPTEASGIGAFGATLLALWNRKLNMKVFREVLRSTYVSLGFVFAIFVGATFFALVLRLLGGDEFIETIMTSLPFGKYGVLVFMLALIFILGFFLDWIEISLIVLPLLGPIISLLNFPVNGYGVVDNPELIWFVVIIAVCLQTSFMTPPVGFSLFFLAGVAPPEVTLKDIYKGIIPFVAIQLVGLICVIIWPQLVLWLPAMIYR